MKTVQIENKKSLPSKTRRIRGQGMTEYIIIVALIAVAAIGVVGAFGGVIQGQFGVMASKLSGGTGAKARKTATTAGKEADGGAGVADLGTYESN